MRIAERITEAAAAGLLTPGERRVAEVVARGPELVGFGTVADIARASGTSGPTVLRLAQKLGFDGFAAMQADVQVEMESRLRPAVERIRDVGELEHAVARTLDRSLTAVQRTLEQVDIASFDRAVDLLAGRARHVYVLSGEASGGVARMAADGLELLRPGVSLVTGSPVGVAKRLAHVRPADVVLAIDVRRYEQWVVDAVTAVAVRGASIVAVTDSPLSPLADRSAERFLVRAEGPGPFDSHVGTLALLDALVAGVADALRTAATKRLDAVEAAWADHLVD